MDGQINEWRPGIKRGDWEGFPWVGTGKQSCDGKLSNSFHRLPEDWSFTRARWAGATGAAWRSWTKPRHRDRAEPYHHSAHDLLPPPTPPPKSHQHQPCLCTQTHCSRSHRCLVRSEQLCWTGSFDNLHFKALPWTATYALCLRANHHNWFLVHNWFNI